VEEDVVVEEHLRREEVKSRLDLLLHVRDVVGKMRTLPIIMNRLLPEKGQSPEITVFLLFRKGFSLPRKPFSACQAQVKMS
jgi:hypothetical protein